MITTKLHPALNAPIDDNVDGIQVDHNKIIADLVESNFNLVGIARDHKLKLTQLIAWAAQPAVRALFEAANELARCISDFKALQARAGAIETLVRHTTGLCETPRDRDLASRAARTLIRISEPRKPRRKTAVPQTAALNTGTSPAPAAPTELPIHFPEPVTAPSLVSLQHLSTAAALHSRAGAAAHLHGGQLRSCLREPAP